MSSGHLWVLHLWGGGVTYCSRVEAGSTQQCLSTMQTKGAGEIIQTVKFTQISVGTALLMRLRNLNPTNHLNYSSYWRAFTLA